jgi:hypothetical protein
MMTLPQLQSFLLWNAALNYAILVVTFLAWVLAGDFFHRLHARWFAMDRGQGDRAIYLMLGFYKLGIWMFFLIPWLVLYILRSREVLP